MTTLASSRLRAYVLFAGAGLLAGLLLGRPEPVVVAAPFLLAVGVALALARPPRLELAVRLERERAIEGDEVGLEVEVRALEPVAQVAVQVLAPPGLRLLPEAGPGWSGLRAGARRTLRRRLECRRWGGREVGRVRVQARDPLGFF